MKKKQSFIWILLCVLLGTTGCTMSNESSEQETKNTEEEVYEESLSTESNNLLNSSFDTYEEFEAWLFSEQEVNSAREDMSNYGAIYETFISDLLEYKIYLMKPYMSGELMELRNKDRFTNILVLSQDYCDRPWIWYFCKVNDRECRIQIMYMTEKETQYAKTHTIEELMRYLSVTEPNKDNLKDSKVYEYMRLKDMTLGDRSVTAFCAKMYNDKREYRRLVYDNLYVILVAEEEVFEETNWETFSFRYD